ncbi:MAG: sulfurtransferase-like selenium metabolism protein YedF [Bacteroidales bacterium]|nr:sulfurtransferase-like selenium metabolism protein YedF [Bacteroidales bacterium]
MKIIDVRGKKCPMPLIETKKALKELGQNETLKVLLDSETSVQNVMRYLKDNGISAEQHNTGNEFEVLINTSGQTGELTEVDPCCDTPIPVDKSYVVVFAKDRIGEGDNELGLVLAGSMLNTIREYDVLPQKIIFMNAGINLVLKGAPALVHLTELEKRGVEIITCGTCLNYFEKADQLAVGRVTNMYEILDSLLKAGKVINL